MGTQLYVCKTHKVDYESVGLYHDPDFFFGFLRDMCESLGICCYVDDANTGAELPSSAVEPIREWLAGKGGDDVIPDPLNVWKVTYGKMREVFEAMFAGYDKDNSYIRVEWF